ncbi:hypothetical protein ABZ863_09140 [Saccharomonospora sp. NPDC046836]|uniref:hypothetical protein n=1 Tax=Saccharomonospora sp. NPDC046836 TaxID=3156921 RepID=UPI0033EF0E83
MATALDQFYAKLVIPPGDLHLYLTIIEVMDNIGKAVVRNIRVFGGFQGDDDGAYSWHRPARGPGAIPALLRATVYLDAVYVTARLAGEFVLSSYFQLTVPRVRRDLGIAGIGYDAELIL